MNCPYCAYHFGVLGANGDINEAGSRVPILCERCTSIGLLEGGTVRQATAFELAAIKQSPAYKDFLGPMIDRINGALTKQQRH